MSHGGLIVPAVPLSLALPRSSYSTTNHQNLGLCSLILAKRMTSLSNLYSVASSTNFFQESCSTSLGRDRSTIVYQDWEKFWTGTGSPTDFPPRTTPFLLLLLLLLLLSEFSLKNVVQNLWVIGNIRKRSGGSVHGPPIREIRRIGKRSGRWRTIVGGDDLNGPV